MKITKKKVLLLGSNGQLGSDIVKEFLPVEEIELIALTRVEIDAEVDEVDVVLVDYSECDALINCISYHKTDECEENPQKCFAINATFVFQLAKFCSKNGMDLYHVSTDYVFDGCRESPYTEDDPVAPLNVYGVSKAAGESLVRQYAPAHYILRVSSLFGVAGASGKGGNFVETMIKLAREGKELRVIDDQFMSPTYTRDVARAMLSLVVSGTTDYGTYHCCNGGNCTWYQFTKAIFSLGKIDADLSGVAFTDYSFKAPRPRYSVMNNSRLNPYYEMPHWEDALRRYLREKGHLLEVVNP